jgi:WD40 repeat protein
VGSRATVTLAERQALATVQGYSVKRGILALEDGDGKQSFVDVKTGATLAHLNRRPSGERFYLFSADGDRAVAMGSGELVLWDVRTGDTLKRWAVPGSTYAVRMTADGKEPAAVVLREWRGERRQLLWGLQLGKAVAVLRGHGGIEAAAFSPDGQTLATIAADGTVLLWDAVTGHARGPLGTNLSGFMTQLVFRPDGRGLAVGAYGGTIRLWTVP